MLPCVYLVPSIADWVSQTSSMCQPLTEVNPPTNPRKKHLHSSTTTVTTTPQHQEKRAKITPHNKGLCWTSWESNPGPFACPRPLHKHQKGVLGWCDIAKRTLYQLSHTPVDMYVCVWVCVCVEAMMRSRWGGSCVCV
jgi:hypothetical protein